MGSRATARDESGLALFFVAVGVALVDDGGAVQEAVEGGGGRDGIAGEDVTPQGEGLDEVDDGRALLLVAAADHLEEHGGLLGIEPEVADFVDDEQPWRGQHLQVVRQPVLGEGRVHPPGQLQGREEQQPMTHLRTQHPQSDGEVRLPDTGRTEEDEVAALVQVAAGGEFFDQGAVDRGLEGEVKVAEPRGPRQTRKTQTRLHLALTTRLDLRREQAPEEVSIRPPPRGHLLGDLVELHHRRGRADLGERAHSALLVGDTHDITSA